MIDDETKFFINPTGRFVIGGPHGDAGLTGRKIIVDTYGGYARHGGGAFSGKDCTKVDRSAAYAARYVAKNIVAAGLADKCEIQLSYAIGVAEPTSIMVDTFGTGKKSNQELVDLIRKHFDLRPAGIIKMLDLRRPIYKQTAAMKYATPGTLYMDAGEEMCNSVNGTSLKDSNLVEWQDSAEFADVVSYYRGLMDIRKALLTACQESGYSFQRGICIDKYNKSQPVNGIAWQYK